MEESAYFGSELKGAEYHRWELTTGVGSSWSHHSHNPDQRVSNACILVPSSLFYP